MALHWKTTRFHIDLAQPRVMGIVNLTPDSFSDGGRLGDVRAALKQCEQMIKDGVHILDLGAESTRPGATPVPVEEELARLQGVLSEAVRFGIPVSIDTYKPEIMRAALDMGADIINDVWALRQNKSHNCPCALDVVAAHPSCGVCLMHMHGDPETMHLHPMVGKVVDSVKSFLRERAVAVQAQGVSAARIVVDPGVGFGKTSEQNLELLAQQRDFSDLGFGLLVGWSRKSTLGIVVGEESTVNAGVDLRQRRLIPSVVAALLAVQRGAQLIRVHDVRETVQALKIWQAAGSLQSDSLQTK